MSSNLNSVLMIRPSSFRRNSETATNNYFQNEILNLNNDSIKTIWNNEIINDLRKDHLDDKRKNHNPCDRCGAYFK